MSLRNIAAVIITIAFFAFQMYIALWEQFAPMLQSPLHLIFALTLVFIITAQEDSHFCKWKMNCAKLN